MDHAWRIQYARLSFIKDGQGNWGRAHFSHLISSIPSHGRPFWTKRDVHFWYTINIYNIFLFPSQVVHLNSPEDNIQLPLNMSEWRIMIGIIKIKFQWFAWTILVSIRKKCSFIDKVIRLTLQLIMLEWDMNKYILSKCWYCSLNWRSKAAR